MKVKQQHVDAPAGTKNPMKTINSKVFDSFNQLTNYEKVQRISGAVDLLQHLSKNQHDIENKEISYSLQRMIRGVGASTSVSRTGFYTTLVAFLSLSGPEESVTVTHIFEVMEKQLHVGKGTSSEKEDSDALIGHILICGALLHSRKILSASDEEVSKCIQVLVNASRHKSFHSALAYTFLIELLSQLAAEQFVSAVWPVMRKELKRPWEKHTINTVHFLIEAQTKYPNLIDEEYLTSSIKTSEILTPLAFKHFSRLFWSNTSTTVAVTHPAYDSLGEFLAKSVSTKALLKFWNSEINEILLAPNKIKEVVTLKVLTNIFNNSKLSAEHALKLLSPALIKLIANSVRTVKQQKNEYVVPFYDDFFEAVGKYIQSLGTANAEGAETAKVNIIKCFVQHPGNLLIEKFTSYRIIHKFIGHLNSDGVSQMFEFYKGILLEKIVKVPKKKSEKWQQPEKEHSVQMLQTLIGLKSVSGAIDWRAEQLQFLFKLGCFNPSAKDGEAAAIANKLAAQVKQVFYASLQIKSARLEDELKILQSIVEFCNEKLSTKSPNKLLRQPITDEVLACWKQMYGRVSAVGKETTLAKLNVVFKILLLHMGLQLFREPQMAQSAISDLEKCMERTQKRIRRKESVSNEPEWIEVVVDLFMHLLSQNTGFLRNIVDSVFPYLCENMSLTAVHQILSILDMRDGKNPLSGGAEDDSDDGDDGDSDESENEEENPENDDEESQESDAEENDSETEDDDDISMDGDEGTVTDQLRSAVSSALGSTAVETDTESVDLNDMNDEDAERLDNAIAGAFKSMGIKFGGNGNKKTKSERITQTSVMHFRIRVLDLIEIYLKSKPSLAITLEILLELINMTELSRGNKDLQPLSFKLDRILKTLLALREFSTVDDVTEKNLADLLNSLLERKVDAAAFDTHHKLVSKVSVFLINATEALGAAGKVTAKSPLYALLDEKLRTLLQKKKSYVINISTFSDILKIRWHGVWLLAQTLVKYGLTVEHGAKAIRRIQALELLSVVYKNHGFIQHDIKAFNKLAGPIERGIEAYSKWLQQADVVKTAEFNALVHLLLDIHKLETATTDVKSKLDWNLIGAAVQTIRKSTHVSYQPYVTLCKRLELEAIKNADVVVATKNGTSNGNERNEASDSDDEGEQQPTQLNGNRKRKAVPDPAKGKAKINAKKQKKLKKLERMKVASVGLDGASFNLNGSAGQNGEEEQDSD